jgi:hypothetical protein
VVAPDAQSVVVRRGGRGAAEIYPVSNGAARPIAAIGTDDEILRWNTDGTLTIAHSTPGRVPVRLERLRIETGERELIRVLTPPNPVGANAITLSSSDTIRTPTRTRSVSSCRDSS